MQFLAFELPFLNLLSLYILYSGFEKMWELEPPVRIWLSQTLFNKVGNDLFYGTEELLFTIF